MSLSGWLYLYICLYVFLYVGPCPFSLKVGKCFVHVFVKESLLTWTVEWPKIIYIYIHISLLWYCTFSVTVLIVIIIITRYYICLLFILHLMPHESVYIYIFKFESWQMESRQQQTPIRRNKTMDSTHKACRKKHLYLLTLLHPRKFSVWLHHIFEPSEAYMSNTICLWCSKGHVYW